MSKVPILMYHALEDDNYPSGYLSSGDQVYVLNADKFREQMLYMAKNGYKTFLIDDLLSLGKIPDKAVVMTFDDGHYSNSTLALPILSEFGFVAEFFVTTDYIDTKDFLSREQVRHLYTSGMGIGSHGVSHRYLNSLSETDAIYELEQSKIVLTDIIGDEIRGISFPGGREPTVSYMPYSWSCSSRVEVYDGLGRFLLPRFSIKHDTTLEDFIAIVSCDGMMLMKAKIRYYVLLILKMLLGNRGYTFLHKFLAKII